MKKSMTLEVEKISNGYLFTENINQVQGNKTFNEKKCSLFDILKNSDTIGGMIEDDENIMLIEVIRHDINTQPLIAETNKTMLENVVIKAKYNPFPSRKEEEALRISVNENNAYTPERLKKIDFNDYNKKFPLVDKRKAEIIGVGYGTFLSSWNKIQKGKNSFSHINTRIQYTVLAKYYEAMSGAASCKIDEIGKLKEGIVEQIKELDIIFQKHAHIHSNNVEPIIYALKALLKIANE
jgi:hypothetical protein